MMELTIHTYGYRDALYYVLNGIAMFRNSGLYEAMINCATVLVGSFYGFRLAASANYGNMMFYLRKTFGMLIFANLILMPKTEMILRDHIGKTIDKIDNIPLAFALPVGIIENFGQVITLGFEQVFAPIETAVNPGDPVFSYYNYGMIFGARLKQEVNQVKIKNPEFVGNMRSFIKQCVMLPAAIGYQFTKEELVNSKDMWKLVSSRAGTLTRTDVTIGKERTTMNCKEAADYFEKYWEGENNRIFDKFRNTDFGKARSSANYRAPDITLSKVFENNVKVLHQGVRPAKEILRQQMMINSMPGNNKSGAYAVSRARMQQEASSSLTMDIAGLYLPMCLAVFKCIYYSAFIFLVPMMLFSGGFNKYLSYLTWAASLQLWPAINAILNMIIGTYSNLKIGNSMLVSFSTTSTVSNHIDSIVYVAAGLQLTVPVIAYYMTNFGSGMAMQMAGSMNSIMQAGFAGVAGETTTGNRSFDNQTENTVSKNNSNTGKLDHNLQYFDGVNSIHTSDGGIRRRNPDGNVVFSGGAGSTTSAGSVRFNTEDNLQNQFSQGIQQSDALVDRSSRSYSESKSNTMNKATDFVAQLAKREHEGESFNYDSLGEQGKALRQAVNETKMIEQQNNYGWKQSAGMSVEGHAKAGTPFGGILGSELGGSISGSTSAENSSDQSVGKKHAIDRGNHTDQSYSNIVRAASNSNWARENSLDTRLSDEVRASYAEEKRHEEQLSKARESSKNWHDAQTRFNSKGATMNRDRYDDVMQELVKLKHARNPDEARQLIESGAPVASEVWNGMVNREFNSFMGGINAGKSRVQGQAADRELDSFDHEHAGKITKEIRPDQFAEFQKVMDENGFNPNQVRNEVNNAETNLKGKHSHITAENETQISSVKKANEMDERDLKQRADKMDKWRASKYIGIGGSSTDSGQDYDHSTRPTASSNVRTFSMGKEGREVVADSNMLNNSPEISAIREKEASQNAVNDKPASLETTNDKAAVNSSNTNTLKDLPEMTADKRMQQQLEDFKVKAAKPSTVDQGSYQKALNTKPKTGE